MPQQVFGPIEVTKNLARHMRHQVSGMTYILDGRGSVLAQDADVGWFLAQGFTVTGGATMMYSPVIPARALSRPVFCPVSNTTYFLDSRGGAAIAAGDVGWFRAQGFLSDGQ